MLEILEKILDNRLKAVLSSLFGPELCCKMQDCLWQPSFDTIDSRTTERSSADQFRSVQGIRYFWPSIAWACSHSRQDPIHICNLHDGRDFYQYRKFTHCFPTFLKVVLSRLWSTLHLNSCFRSEVNSVLSGFTLPDATTTVRYSDWSRHYVLACNGQCRDWPSPHRNQKVWKDNRGRDQPRYFGLRLGAWK